MNPEQVGIPEPARLQHPGDALQNGLIDEAPEHNAMAPGELPLLRGLLIVSDDGGTAGGPLPEVMGAGP